MVYDIVVSLLLFFSGIFFLVIIFIIIDKLKLILSKKSLLSKNSSKLNLIKDKWLSAIDKTDLKAANFTTLKNFLNASFVMEGESKRYKTICNELTSRGYVIVMLEVKPGAKFPLIRHKSELLIKE